MPTPPRRCSRAFWLQRLAALATELARGRRAAGRAALPHDHDTTRPTGKEPMTDIDVAGQLTAIHREVQLKAADTAADTAAPDGGDVVAVLLRREYTADAADVWDALTDPERLGRWFLPVTGDLRPGGTFQTEGNAGGEILTCDAPRLLRVTWGDATSIVALRLTAVGADRTTVELEHTVPVAFAGSGAGALYVGPGWDQTLVALALHFAGHPDPRSVEESPQGLEIGTGSVEAWTAAVETSGTATPEEITAARDMAVAQYATAATP